MENLIALFLISCSPDFSLCREIPSVHERQFGDTETCYKAVDYAQKSINSNFRVIAECVPISVGDNGFTGFAWFFDPVTGLHVEPVSEEVSEAEITPS